MFAQPFIDILFSLASAVNLFGLFCYAIFNSYLIHLRKKIQNNKWSKQKEQRTKP